MRRLHEDKVYKGLLISLCVEVVIFAMLIVASFLVKRHMYLRMGTIHFRFRSDIILSHAAMIRKRLMIRLIISIYRITIRQRRGFLRQTIILEMTGTAIQVNFGYIV